MSDGKCYIKQQRQQIFIITLRVIKLLLHFSFRRISRNNFCLPQATSQSTTPTATLQKYISKHNFYFIIMQYHIYMYSITVMQKLWWYNEAQQFCYTLKHSMVFKLTVWPGEYMCPQLIIKLQLSARAHHPYRNNLTNKRRSTTLPNTIKLW